MARARAPSRRPEPPLRARQTISARLSVEPMVEHFSECIPVRRAQALTARVRCFDLNCGAFEATVQHEF